MSKVKLDNDVRKFLRDHDISFIDAIIIQTILLLSIINRNTFTREKIIKDIKDTIDGFDDKNAASTHDFSYKLAEIFLKNSKEIKFWEKE